jgi:purine-cytosine permease-like protein
MIQRIQSIFLFLSAAAFGGSFAVPFAVSSEPIEGMMDDRIYSVTDHPVLMGIAILGILLSLLAIFQYKNREKQQRLGYMVIIMGIFLPLVAFLLIYNEGTNANNSTEISDGYGVYLPLFSLIMCVLAIRYIRKDDKLVKSMDRLR